MTAQVARVYDSAREVTDGSRKATCARLSTGRGSPAAVTRPCVPRHEGDLPVFVCGRPEMPLKRLWPQVECYSR